MSVLNRFQRYDASLGRLFNNLLVTYPGPTP